MAKTRFIYTTDDKIISGATKLRPKQVPNPPPPPARFSDDENVTKVLYLDSGVKFVFAIVKSAEISFGNGPAVNPIYALYVYDPDQTILCPIGQSFHFEPSDNGWSRLTETDSGTAVKVVSFHKIRKTIGPEELNVYRNQLFVIANIGNETVLLQLDFNIDTITMNLEFDHSITAPGDYYEYIRYSADNYYSRNQKSAIYASTSLEGFTPGSYLILKYVNDSCSRSLPQDPRGAKYSEPKKAPSRKHLSPDQIPVIGSSYSTRRQNSVSTTTDNDAFWKFWEDNFILSDAQKDYLYREFENDFGSRIISENFIETTTRDVYCVYPITKEYRYTCRSLSGYSAKGIAKFRYGSCKKNIFGGWNPTLLRRVVEAASLTADVPTNRTYTTMNTRMVKIDEDPLIKKIICFDDYKRVYAICSQVTEPNNSLYRIR